MSDSKALGNLENQLDLLEANLADLQVKVDHLAHLIATNLGLSTDTDAEKAKAEQDAADAQAALEKS